MRNCLGRLGARALRLRWFARAPILAYRWHLGRLFGHRLLLLEHLGRRSGRWRQVCLEVVDQPDSQCFVVVSGFGERSQWFRNLKAHAECRVSIGRYRRVRTTAAVLSKAEADMTLRRYATRHPRAWRRLEGVLAETLDRPDEVPPVVALVVQAEP